MQLGLVPVGTTDDCNESEWIETGVEVTVGECPVKVTLTCFFVAVDACGNTSATATSTINIIDDAAPVITCPSDITVDCTSSLDPMATGMASASDACGDATVSYTDGAITGTCPQTLVRTWTATDECGLTSTLHPDHHDHRHYSTSIGNARRNSWHRYVRRVEEKMHLRLAKALTKTASYKQRSVVQAALVWYQ